MIQDSGSSSAERLRVVIPGERCLRKRLALPDDLIR